MKVTLIPVLALGGVTIARSSSPILKRGEPECDTENGDPIPADNDDCSVLCDSLNIRPDAEYGLNASDWNNMAFHGSCMPVTKVDEDATITNQDLIDDINAIQDACKGDADWKGQVIGEGRTTALYGIT